MKNKSNITLNTFFGLVQQLVTIVSGLIIPRMILAKYGSATNGLVSSITQFLALISFCECGVGAVVQSSLYKPLANNDNYQVNCVIKSANIFFRKVAFILVGYVGVLMIIFPFVSNTTLSHLSTAFLIGIIAINTFSQYYLSVTNKILLNAAQLCYIHLICNVVTITISTVISAIMINNNCSIHVVKLAASLIFLAQPLYLNNYVHKKFTINKKVEYDLEPIKQKWNGLSQHFSTVILERTDVVVLTFFSTLENVSVYSVYHMVVYGIRELIVSTMSGIKSFIGNLFAQQDSKNVNQSFDKIEWIVHSVTSLLFTITGILIIPFVKIYTKNIVDVDYILPLFAIILVLSQGIYCIRLPYSYMIQAAGHYKETQISAFIEALLNVVLSILLVFKFGLVGIVIGTLISMTYRTFYMVWYLSKNIIHRPLRHFIEYFTTDIFYIVSVSFLLHFINCNADTYIQWFIYAIKVSFISFVGLMLFNIIFHRKNVSWILSVAKNKIKSN